MMRSTATSPFREALLAALLWRATGKPIEHDVGELWRRPSACARPCATSTPSSPHLHEGEVRFVDLHTLLADSGYVTIHTALTDETEGLVDAAAIVRMRPGSVPS